MTSNRLSAKTNDSAPRSALRRWAAAFVVWVAVIWGNSLVQGPQSSLESGAVVQIVRPLFEAVGVFDVSLMGIIVRKCAHFSEYAVLGVLSRGLFATLRRERGLRAWPRAALVGLVSVADECLQLMVPGRTGLPTDVLIDLTGLAAGALLAHLAGRLRHR